MKTMTKINYSGIFGECEKYFAKQGRNVALFL